MSAKRIIKLKNALDKHEFTAEMEIDILNNLAWELRYIDKKNSLLYARQALNKATETDYEAGVAVAKMNCAIAEFFTSQKQTTLKKIYEAYSYFTDKKRPLEQARAMLYLSNIYDGLGSYEKAMEFCQNALKIAKEIRNNELESDIYSQIGIIQNRLGDFRSALEAYQQSLNIRQENNNLEAVASSLNQMARIYCLDGNYQKSLIHYNESLKLRKNINDKAGLPWTYIGLASLYESMQNNEVALVNYSQALLLFENAGEQRGLIHCYMGMGRIKTQTRHFDTAQKYLNKALGIAQSETAKPLKYEIHLALADLYSKTGDVAKALEHHKLYHSIKEEVLNSEVQNKLKNQQIEFAIEKSKKETQLQRLRNIELKNAYDLIERKNKNILASIEYASRIQGALLPSTDIIDSYFPQNFIYFNPRDVVSGDFYWTKKVASYEDILYIFVTADCTGHGVPGAFMSLLGISYLNEIVSNTDVFDAAEILNKLRSHIIDALNQNGHTPETKDGMDLTLCIFDFEKQKLQYAGANNPLILIRENKLIEYKADRMPIGYYFRNESFKNHVIDIQENDIIYTYSDGFVDQFGEKENRKFLSKNFRRYLIENHQLPLDEQKQKLHKTFLSWKGNEQQLDDIIVVGIKV